MNQPVPAAPTCGSCNKPVKPGTASVAFKQYHRDCIARLVEQQRSLY